MDTTEGHQFVIDGYNSDRQVHVNWGWGGSCNGWYAVCYLGDKDNKGVDDVFNYWDSAILGLKKGSGSDSANALIYIDSYDEESDPGLNITGTIAKGSTFTLDAYLYNTDTYSKYSGAVKAALVDKDGNLLEYISSEKNVTIDVCDGQYLSYTSFSASCKITRDIAPGDFICLYFKNGGGEWMRVGGTNHTVSNTEYDYGVYYSVSRISALQGISYIYAPSTLNAGEVFYFDVVTGGNWPTSITWTYDGSSVTTGFVTLTAGTHTVKAVIKNFDGTSQTLVRKIKVN